MKCDTCGNNNWKKYNNLLMQCEVCNLIRANQEFSNIKIHTLYNHDYFFGSEYFDYLRDKKALEQNFQDRISYLENLGIVRKKQRCIEIGCAYGFFMNLIKSKIQMIIGFDVSKEGVNYAKRNFGVDARCENFLKYDGEKVNIVFMWDVIEHLSRPSLFIKKIQSVLVKDGVLVLTTGDIGSFLAKIQGNKWRMIHPPSHLFYYDKKTITSLLNQYGFEVLDIKYNKTYRNVVSSLQQLNLTWFANLFILMGLKNFICRINTFDIMQIIAVKK